MELHICLPSACMHEPIRVVVVHVLYPVHMHIQHMYQTCTYCTNGGGGGGAGGLVGC